MDLRSPNPENIRAGGSRVGAVERRHGATLATLVAALQASVGSREIGLATLAAAIHTSGSVHTSPRSPPTRAPRTLDREDDEVAAVARRDR